MFCRKENAPVSEMPSIVIMAHNKKYLKTAGKDRRNAQGINGLLNVGPDYLGRIPFKAVEILQKMR